MKSKYTKAQITAYAERLAKLELMFFDVITDTEEFLKDPISKYLMHDSEEDVVLKKIAKAVFAATGSTRVQEVAVNNSVFDDYDCIATAINAVLEK